MLGHGAAWLRGSRGYTFCGSGYLIVRVGAGEGVS